MAAAVATKERFPCSGIEGVKLKYLRFACSRPEHTVEFYQSLGMTLEGKLDFRKTITYRFSYRISNPTLSENAMALLFDVPKRYISQNVENETRQKREEARKARSSATGNSSDPLTPEEVVHVEEESDDDDDNTLLFDKNKPRDYLVIYVHFLGRILKRLKAKSHKLLVDIKTYMEIQYAIVLDPNGIEVRLIEMSDVQLNELTKKSQWFARLGYYVIHVHGADDLRKYLESLFSKQKKVLTKKAPPDDPDGQSTSFGVRDSLDRGKKIYQSDRYNKACQLLLHGIWGTHREGFRLVDYEDIITGLSHTAYHWLGHDTREKLCALCLTERVHEQRQPLSEKDQRILPRDTKLISLGFEIAGPLDSAVNQLQKEVSSTVFFTGVRLHVPGTLHDLGYVAQFRGLHNLTLDLYSSLDHAGGRVDNRVGTVSSAVMPGDRRGSRGRRSQQNRRLSAAGGRGGGMIVGKPGSGRPSTSQPEYYINYNQTLRAVLSESSLMRDPVWDAGDENELDAELGPAVTGASPTKVPSAGRSGQVQTPAKTPQSARRNSF
ncbi:hypothetical protein RI367_003163 [Sorochytrium milnesiophthora]